MSLAWRTPQPRATGSPEHRPPDRFTFHVITASIVLQLESNRRVFPVVIDLRCTRVPVTRSWDHTRSVGPAAKGRCSLPPAPLRPHAPGSRGSAEATFERMYKFARVHAGTVTLLLAAG